MNSIRSWIYDTEMTKEHDVAQARHLIEYYKKMGKQAEAVQAEEVANYNEKTLNERIEYLNKLNEILDVTKMFENNMVEIKAPSKAYEAYGKWVYSVMNEDESSDKTLGLKKELFNTIGIKD